MPTYQYRCTACSKELEAVQKFTDASLTTCPSCDGALRKVFGAVGVVFKGSGFYSTDSRKKSSSTSASSSTKTEASSTSTTPSESSKPAPPTKAEATA
ncbi:MAG: FmdB family zinc ribbon protein [Arachnia sp.]